MATTQKSVFDLDAFEDVVLFKSFEECKVPQNLDEAKEAVGGDLKKLLSILHSGLVAEQAKVLRAEVDGWEIKDEQGNLIPFNGVIANQEAVNNLVLTLAKTIYGYKKEQSLEVRKAAKESAARMIRGNDTMKEGLKRSAAAVE